MHSVIWNYCIVKRIGMNVKLLNSLKENENMTVNVQADENILVEKTPANLFKGMEAVGGKLTITDKRLIFKAHKLNIQGGTTEILMSDIFSVDKASTLKIISNRMIVKTKYGEAFKFVVYKRDKLVDIITGHLK